MASAAFNITEEGKVELHGPIEISFADDLMSIQFRQNGELVHPITVLTLMASNLFVLQHDVKERSFKDSYGFDRTAGWSETWRIVPRE